MRMKLGWVTEKEMCFVVVYTVDVASHFGILVFIVIFIYQSIYLFIYLFIYVCMYVFIYLFIYSFIP